MAKCGDELAQVAETVQNYFDGMHFADASRLRKAFHPKANLSGTSEESFDVFRVKTGSAWSSQGLTKASLA